MTGGTREEHDWARLGWAGLEGTAYLLACLLAEGDVWQGKTARQPHQWRCSLVVVVVALPLSLLSLLPPSPQVSPPLPVTPFRPPPLFSFFLTCIAKQTDRQRGTVNEESQYNIHMLSSSSEPNQ